MTVNLFLPQVTRIPISGPEPFNTLVCVSVDTLQGGGLLQDRVLKRFPQHVVTPFRLAGFDQRVSPVFKHSTTAWLSSTGPTMDGNWIIAVDSVTGAGFDPTDGTYYVDLAAAISIDGEAPGTCIGYGDGGTVCFYFPHIQVTSWVLCYEPPLGPSPYGHHRGLEALIQRGFSAADLARTPSVSPSPSGMAERTMQVMKQAGMQGAFSISNAEQRTARRQKGSKGCNC